MRLRNRGSGEPQIQLLVSSSDEEDDELNTKEPKLIRKFEDPEISTIQEWKDFERMARDKKLPEYVEVSRISEGIYQKCAVCDSLNCKYPHSEEFSNVGLRNKELKDVQESEDIIDGSSLFQEACNRYDATVQDLSESIFLEIDSKKSFIEEICDKKDTTTSKTLIEDITEPEAPERVKIHIENSTNPLIQEISEFCEEELEVSNDESSANITDELEVPETELYFYTISEPSKVEVAGKYKNIPVNLTNPNPTGVSQIKVAENNQPNNTLVVEQAIPEKSYPGVLKTIQEKCKAIYCEPKIENPKIIETKSEVIERILNDPNRAKPIEESNFTIGGEVINVNEIRMKKFREDNDRIKKIIDTVYEQRESYNEKIDAIHTELENIRDDCSKIVSGLHKADELLNGDEIRNFDELNDDSEIHISELPDFIKEIDEYQIVENKREKRVLENSKDTDEEIIDEGIQVTNFVQENQECDNFSFQWLQNIYNSGIFTPSENDDEETEVEEVSTDSSDSENDIIEEVHTDFSNGLEVQALEFDPNTNYELLLNDTSLEINSEDTVEDLEILQKIVSSNKEFLLNHDNPDAREFAKKILDKKN